MISGQAAWDSLVGEFTKVVAHHNSLGTRLDSDSAVVLSTLRRLQGKLTLFIEDAYYHHVELLRRQKQVLECIRCVNVLISPIQRLPCELVCIILQMYLSSEESLRLPPRRDRPNPFIFSQVSQQWRCVTLTRSSVWASVHVEIPQFLTSQEGVRLAEMVEACMDRSRDHLLRIRYSIYPIAVGGEDGTPIQRIRGIHLRKVFNILLVHSRRWQELTIDATYRGFKALLKENPFHPSHPMPRLEMLYLQGGSGSEALACFHEDRPSYRPAPVLSSAPSLRIVSLFDNALPFLSGVLPWTQIEELNLVGLFPWMVADDYIAVFRSCINLRKCRLTSGPSIRKYGTVTNIILNNLESLHIVEEGPPTSGAEIYRRFFCPSLRELGIQFAPQNTDFHPAALTWTRDLIMALVGPGNGNILELQLWNAPLSERDLLSIFLRTPNLIHLTVSHQGANFPLGNQVLHELTIRCASNEGTLLNELVYVCFESRFISARFVEEFIRSRWDQIGGVAQLEHIRLNFFGQILGFCIGSRLARCCDEGLVLELVN